MEVRAQLDLVGATRALWLLMFSAPLVCAALPETGFYWNSEQPSKGYYIELQGNVIGLAAYAFDPDGEPVFYTGSGTLLSNSPGPPNYELPSPVGMFPVHSVHMDLFRHTGGLCLACEFDGAQVGVKVGRASLWFVHPSSPDLEISLSSGAHLQPTSLIRFNFAKEPIGLKPFGMELRATLLGDWVFTEIGDPEALPRRFTFTERIENPLVPGSGPGTTTFDVTFRDPQRNADFRCRYGYGKYGCELSVDGAVYASAGFDDVGLRQLQGYRGPLPPRGSEIGRGPATVIGLRLDH